MLCSRENETIDHPFHASIFARVVVWKFWIDNLLVTDIILKSGSANASLIVQLLIWIRNSIVIIALWYYGCTGNLGM